MTSTEDIEILLKIIEKRRRIREGKKRNKPTNVGKIQHIVYLHSARPTITNRTRTRKLFHFNELPVPLLCHLVAERECKSDGN